MASQVPAGALVDAVPRKSLVAVFSILAFTASALLFTVAPIPLFVYLGQVLHAFSSCTLGPAIVAMSVAVAGQLALGPRLGRNARFASIGNAVGAALMGACGYYVSERAVFYMTAALTLPALGALLPLARFERRASTSSPPAPPPPPPPAEEEEGAAPPRARRRLRLPRLPAVLPIAGCSFWRPAPPCSPLPTPPCCRWRAAPSPRRRPIRRAC